MVKIAIEVDNTNSQEQILDISLTFAEAIGVVGESTVMCVYCLTYFFNYMQGYPSGIILALVL